MDKEMNNIINSMNSFLDNKVVKTVLVVIVLLYACNFKDLIPKNLMAHADNPIVKIVVLTLVAFMANNDLMVSIMIAVGFLLTTSLLNLK